VSTKQRLTAEPPPLIAPQEVSQQPIPVPQVAQDGEDRRLVGETPGEDVTKPTDEERNQFITLMSCGKRSKSIDVMGHPVVVESLNVDDDLRIGLFTKDYRESDAYPSAVRLATCAAGVRTIGGRALYTPISTDETSESIFRAKLEKLLKYHTSVITEIYREIVNLDIEFGELALKLGKLKG
jgi:hypothetical protein